VRLWNVSDPASPRPFGGGPLTGPRSLVAGVAFSPDGSTVAAGTSDASVLVWNVATRALTATLPAPQLVTALALGRGRAAGRRRRRRHRLGPQVHGDQVGPEPGAVPIGVGDVVAIAVQEHAGRAQARPRPPGRPSPGRLPSAAASVFSFALLSWCSLLRRPILSVLSQELHP
jgi:hypothetical protein